MGLESAWGRPQLIAMDKWDFLGLFSVFILVKLLSPTAGQFR
jgi:hypothetical protein